MGQYFAITLSHVMQHPVTHYHVTMYQVTPYSALMLAIVTTSPHFFKSDPI
jgi:hypothetical protein